MRNGTNVLVSLLRSFFWQFPSELHAGRRKSFVDATRSEHILLAKLSWGRWVNGLNQIVCLGTDLT